MNRLAESLLSNPQIAKLLGRPQYENATEEAKTQFNIDVPKYYPGLNKAANALIPHLGPKFTSTRRGHIQTDIAAASSLAGLMILRASNLDLSPYEPGASVEVDVGDAKDDVQAFMAKVVKNVKLDPQKGWTDPIHDSDRPKFTFLELTEKLEAIFVEACQEAELPRECYPYAAALATVKLISAGTSMRLIDQNTAKALAAFYLATGCKTAPHPAPKVSKPTS